MSQKGPQQIWRQVLDSRKFKYVCLFPIESDVLAALVVSFQLPTAIQLHQIPRSHPPQDLSHWIHLPVWQVTYTTKDGWSESTAYFMVKFIQTKKCKLLNQAVFLFCSNKSRSYTLQATRLKHAALKRVENLLAFRWCHVLRLTDGQYRCIFFMK